MVKIFGCVVVGVLYLLLSDFVMKFALEFVQALLSLRDLQMEVYQKSQWLGGLNSPKQETASSALTSDA